MKLYENPDKVKTALPEGTTVLVLEEEGSRAQSLEDLGIDRKSLRQRLRTRAHQSPEALLDTLGESGKTQNRYKKGSLYYLLARTQKEKLYESVADKEEDLPGFDLVDAGEMGMKRIEEGGKVMRNAFEEVVGVAKTTRLTLQTERKKSLPAGTEVRIWKREEGRRAIQNRAFLESTSDITTRLDSSGRIQNSIDRTWHSGRILYVAARTPDSTLYESQFQGGAGFVQVDVGDVTVAPVPYSGQEAVHAVFSSSLWVYKKLAGWEGWLVFLLVGLISGLAGARLWYEEKLGEEKRKKNTLKAEQQKKQGNTPQAGKKRVRLSRSNSQDSSAGETIERMREKNNELRQEISELREKVQKRDKELQNLKRNQPSPQKQPSPSSQEDTRPAPTQSPSTSQPPQNPARKKTGETFMQWCTEKSPVMVSKYQLFADEVESALPDASFRRITREKNAAGLVFDNDAQDPVEYWLVEADGQHFLLPQPSRDRFRELGECFDGQNTAPAEVSSVRPALLKRKGGRLVLEEKGQIA